MTIEDRPHLQLAGNIREFAPSIRDIPPGPRSRETRDLLKRGQLMWAGDDFLRPGLYMWTGKVYILIESKQNILVKMEGSLGNAEGLILKADYLPPTPHNEREEEE